MKRLRAWLGVLLVFLLGMVCGSVLSIGFIKQKARLLMNGGSAKVEDPIVGKLRRDLRLDSAQEAEVKKIVADARGQIEGAKQKIQPDIRAALQQGEDRVRAVLRPEQLPAFEKLLNEGRGKWRPATPM